MAEPVSEERGHLTSVVARVGRALGGDPQAVLEPDALDEVRQLVASVGQDDYDLPHRYALGWLFWCRFRALPDGEGLRDLKAAVEMFTFYFLVGFDDKLPEPLLPLLAERAFPTANAMLERCFGTDDPALVSRTVELWRRILAAAPASHPDRAAMLSNLGEALATRYEHSGAPTDLDAAITSLREALAVASADHFGRGGMLSGLGEALRLRFERTGARADLDEAIDVGRAAVAATAADHPKRGGRLSNFACGLQARYERSGTQAALDAAIETFREALAAAPADSPGRGIILSNLGSALRLRYERTGARADLDEAIDVGRAGVEATPPGHPYRAMHLSNLGIALLPRYKRTKARADVDEAIEVCRAAVEATPLGHLHRAMYLCNLGAALMESADLDAAIETLQDAVEAAPVGKPSRLMYLSNLGFVLRGRYQRGGARADLDAAIEAAREAVEAAPADHPTRVMYLINLGDALRARGARTDLDAALSLYEQAAELDSAAASMRIHAAHAAARLAAPAYPGRAADLLETAVRLLPEVTPRQLEHGERRDAIGGLTGLGPEAVAFALAEPDTADAERATRALRLLEASRAVLLSQALDTRSDLSDLRERHPDLAARFVELRDRLDRQPAPVGLMPAPSGARPDSAADRRRAAAELTATLDRIRALPGFASFALPPALDELLAQADEGPVVSFNISRYRCDALLLTTGGVTSLELPGATYPTVVDRINAFHRAVFTTTDPTASGQERRAAQAELRRILEWLWDAAAEPVLHALGHYREPAPGTAWPRVWWAPGGLLGLLPLHAAGYHTDPPGPGRRTVLDRVISSYTPTIRALRHARGRANPRRTADRTLIVAMPTTPGVDGRLHHVQDEATLLSTRLPGPVLLIEPGGPAGAPTKANVLAHLPGCAIAHFACHAASDPTDPSRSRLLLHDHRDDPLDVASLAPVDLDRAGLAYLSACSTAVNAANELLDEAIHLTSAFQLAGFPHVIGTLWQVNDSIAVQIADAFYRALGTKGTVDTGQAAHALHHAVRAMRDRFPTKASLWAAHLHVGA
jgi:tetratricopeptide (TPR) repeat protein